MGYNRLLNVHSTVLNQKWSGEDSIPSALVFDVPPKPSYPEGQIFFPEIERIIAERFKEIGRRKDNWDKQESKAPSAEAIEGAKPFIVQATRFFGQELMPFSEPIIPFVTSDEEGAITVRWRYNKRELHLCFTAKDAEYIKVWGINIHHEMEEGYLKNDSLRSLCQWLLYGSTHR
jgi:hypothetical protein